MAQLTYLLLFMVALSALACGQKMGDQPSYRTFQANTRFADGMSSRPLVAGTVSRDSSQINGPMFTGKIVKAGGDQGTFLKYFPVPINRKVLERGRERFEIYCAPCHGLTGAGDGMVVKRGFSAPPELYIDRLRKAPPGYLFSIPTNGRGAMYSYADRVSVEDRWAIVAYIRALQLRHAVPLSSLPARQQQDAKRNVGAAK
jgi:mono/diheme cytochrome c family protein